MTGGVLEVEIAGDRVLVKVRLWGAVGCTPRRDRDEFLAGYSRWTSLLLLIKRGAHNMYRCLCFYFAIFEALLPRDRLPSTSNEKQTQNWRSIVLGCLYY